MKEIKCTCCLLLTILPFIVSWTPFVPKSTNVVKDITRNIKTFNMVAQPINVENQSEEQLEQKIANAVSIAQPLDVQPFFSALASSEIFINEYWQKKPLLYSKIMHNMDGKFTMSEVAKEVEAGFLDAGRGTFVDGRTGWQMANVGKPRGKSFEEAKMRIQDVERALSEKSGTVVFNSAGAKIKPLAEVCYGTAQAVRLPTALNLYLTAAGQTTSAPPHTDKQDVFVLQTQGKKGWRVYSPPNPADNLKVDPFQRGKGTDVLDLESLGEPIIDTVLSPGQMLYVPAGFPHTTDTVTDNEGGTDTSVHLTVGVDTHIWGLTYAHLREFALKKAGEKDTINVQSLDSELFWELQCTLPLGFLDNGAYDRHRRWSETKAALIESMVSGVLPLIRQCEPEKWGSLDDQQLSEKLQIKSVAERLLDHHGKILGVMNEMYLDTIHELTDVPMNLSVFRIKPYMEQLEASMETLYQEFSSSTMDSADDQAPQEKKGFGATGSRGGGNKKKGAKKASKRKASSKGFS
mmetsp:Transcript_30142/g.39702  ORF Transcript_30142/g.39702 Transcript_30142/m.39702 type:complete len:519 (+) Transcript_30142:46-1602(+)